MLDKFNNLINPILNIFSVFLFTLVFIVFNLGIILRYFNYPIFWSIEFCKYIFIWAVLIQAVILVNKRQNLGIDWFISFIPNKKIKKVIEKITILMQLIFVIYITYYGIKMVIINIDRMIPSLQVSFSLVYLAVVISFFIMSISFFIQLFFEK